MSDQSLIAILKLMLRAKRVTMEALGYLDRLASSLATASWASFAVSILDAHQGKEHAKASLKAFRASRAIRLRRRVRD